MTALLPRQVRPTDPLIRWMGGHHPPPALIADGANLAWLGRASRPGESWITGLGDDPDVVARLVVRMAAEHDVDGITVPESVFDLLPARLRSPDPGHWCLWTLDPARAVLGPTSAVELALDDPRIGPLLEHSDSAHIFPGNPRLVRWAGILDGERLVSTAALLTESSGAGHIVSVCTDPDYRGRGLARDVCTWIIRSAIEDGAPMIVLEMYVANEAGRRTYSALGFSEVGRYKSGLLAHVLDR